ncbi:hypothetical protein F4809DRAFT_611152 [Biscogniauxia mediterranea]|nr:hypothetical protein F4809DRAFT_611152 [Biscogniauxia mediterranea]
MPHTHTHSLSLSLSTYLIRLSFSFVPSLLPSLPPYVHAWYGSVITPGGQITTLSTVSFFLSLNKKNNHRHTYTH